MALWSTFGCSSLDFQFFGMWTFEASFPLVVVSSTFKETLLCAGTKFPARLKHHFNGFKKFDGFVSIMSPRRACMYFQDTFLFSPSSYYFLHSNFDDKAKEESPIAPKLKNIIIFSYLGVTWVLQWLLRHSIKD